MPAHEDQSRHAGGSNDDLVIWDGKRLTDISKNLDMPLGCAPLAYQTQSTFTRSQRLRMLLHVSVAAFHLQSSYLKLQ